MIEVPDPDEFVNKLLAMNDFEAANDELCRLIFGGHLKMFDNILDLMKHGIEEYGDDPLEAIAKAKELIAVLHKPFDRKMSS